MKNLMRGGLQETKSGMRLLMHACLNCGKDCNKKIKSPNTALWKLNQHKTVRQSEMKNLLMLLFSYSLMTFKSIFRGISQ